MNHNPVDISADEAICLLKEGKALTRRVIHGQLDLRGLGLGYVVIDGCKMHDT